MKSDFEIGRVVAIDTSQVTIELNPDLKAMTRSTYETTIEVGRINSYVIIPIGARRIVAMVTRVVMTEEAELHTDKTMVSLPSARRLMKATMIGTIDDKKFNQGISLFPVLDTPVLVATKDDLEAIFGVKKSDANGPDAEEPGYCITIGKSVVFPDYNVKINPDVFFGKHAAVIGSTGSGKSCSIATLIQSIFDCPEIKNTTIIILDTNGEYRTAFQSQNANKDWKDVNEKFRCLYIPTDPNLPNERLVIPYWFMNCDDFLRLFQVRAARQTQLPVLIEVLRQARNKNDGTNLSVDDLAYFPKEYFKRDCLEQVAESFGRNTKDYLGTLFLRISRLLADRRFEFLFGPTKNIELPEPTHCLAAFLRDILGLSSNASELSPEDKIQKGTFPFYDRQRTTDGNSHNVIIIDLSLLASEVLENVTALIGRLILEFLQRVSETELSGINRGEFPVVLVLEEAQNYIHVSRGQDGESISREVFERIAREGRKFGLGLVVASQRPSELSKTVLSQCNSFIVHRLQNPEDLRYFREIVPGIYNQLLDQLPALAPRHALVLGEAVNAPALVYMREANPIPQSKDPKFYKQWISESPKIPNVEKVCAKWEGKSENDATDTNNSSNK